MDRDRMSRQSSAGGAVTRLQLLSIAALAVFTAGLAMVGSVPARAAEGPDPSFVAGELLVRFEPGADKAERAAALERVDARKRGSLQLPRLSLIEVDDSSVSRSAEILERQPGVLYAEPNFIDDFDAAPNDREFGRQWALDNTGQGIRNPPVFGTPGADIDAVKGWDRSVGSSNVVIGIADSGVFYAHPDLGPNMYVNPGESGGGKESNGLDDDGNGYVDDFRGYDFFDGDNDPAPGDPPAENRHGTGVASAAAARGNNSIGMTGVAQQASLLPLRIGGGGTRLSAIVDAFIYAGRLGAQVVNLSAGGSNFSQALLDAIRAAPDTLFVFSAGNDGENNDNPSTPHYPSNHNEPNVVAVANTDQNDLLYTSSNFGPQNVDLAAPGTNIVTADIGTDPAVSYRYATGTSFASPIVAGAAAVYRSLDPNATAADTRDALLAGVDPLPSLAGLVESGGRLNLDRTLAIASPPDTTITSGPSGTTNNASPSFGFSSSEAGSTFQCSLDSGAFAACSSPKSYSSLPDGAHNFKVRATDPAGNTDPTPASRDFSVDTTVYKAKIKKVNVSGPGKVKKGKKATYKVKITNSGNAKATGVRLKVKGRGVSFNTSVGKIAAKKTRTVKVKLKAKKPGKVKVKFKVTSKNAGGKTVKKKIKVKK
jgi:hypothetical protein